MARAVAVYTALRALLFGGVYALLLLLGVGSLLALFVALLLSAGLSLVLLRAPRQRLADALAARQERRQSGRCSTSRASRSGAG
jgi:hypothetical protein